MAKWTPDLHELVNKPGAGEAKKVLKESGNYDETLGEEGDRKWRVILTGSMLTHCETVIEVCAPDEEAARKLVLQQDLSSERWDEIDTDYVEDVTIFEVEEIT